MLNFNMRVKQMLMYLVLLILQSALAVLPVEKCVLSDKSCMLPATQKMVPIFTAGMPEYGVEVLDPLAMTDVHVEVAGVNFNMTNSILKGLKRTVIDDTKWNRKKKRVHLDFHGNYSIKCDYKSNGTLLGFPIYGEGEMKVIMKNVKFSVVNKYNIVKHKDKNHVKLTDYKFNFEVVDLGRVEMTNLFNGNKELSDAMLTLMNENWKQLFPIFGQPIGDIIMKDVLKNINKFFVKNPIAEIAIVS